MTRISTTKIPLTSLKGNLAHHVKKHNAATVYDYRKINHIEDWILKNIFSFLKSK